MNDCACFLLWSVYNVVQLQRLACTAQESTDTLASQDLLYALLIFRMWNVLHFESCIHMPLMLQTSCSKLSCPNAGCTKSQIAFKSNDMTGSRDGHIDGS